jgi:hypothetical protein
MLLNLNFVESLRPHQYYDGSRPSIIYVDEPVHVENRETRENPTTKKSFLALASLQIILGIVAIISQVDLTTNYLYFLKFS